MKKKDKKEIDWSEDVPVLPEKMLSYYQKKALEMAQPRIPEAMVSHEKE